MAVSRPRAAGWSGSEWTRMASSSSRVAPRRTGKEGGGGTRGSISMAAAVISLVRRKLPNRAAMPGRGRKPPGRKVPGGKMVEWARGGSSEMQFGPGEMYCETLFVNKVENDRAYFQLSEMSSSRFVTFRHIWFHNIVKVLERLRLSRGGGVSTPAAIRLLGEVDSSKRLFYKIFCCVREKDKRELIFRLMKEIELSFFCVITTKVL